MWKCSRCNADNSELQKRCWRCHRSKGELIKEYKVMQQGK